MSSPHHQPCHHTIGHGPSGRPHPGRPLAPLTPRRANPSASWVSDGHLLVGTEITAGTWRNSGTGDYCYWERVSGFGGQSGDKIASDFTDSPSVVTIAATDVGFFADADCGIWSKIG